MRIKERKLILHFLKQLQTVLENEEKPELNEWFQDFFTRVELINILKHFYTSKDLGGQKIDTLENSDLLELLGEDQVILSFLIEKMEEGSIAVPKIRHNGR
ncbi:MAG: hypothetical protein COW66_13095 [Flavobacteriaceae bacterium CG18_big_fil_WC_8_21_14_2_50_34_36]|nr:hypothetical protein [Flavobacteriia bacterium]NCT18040.1 hypothetical protein [Flavobacteriia bacterium]PIQ17203.1 MAG: hypothetical protein COW66_13095 [Flavobacteriaceae bacterium CG18_big_fil_WC_8_21_14_2_50_34_36]PJC08203.1 MAG: hypothetical protein CO068_02140 [Flavobacteriaceae bacterium CG_4_9_14_0_8_um_filter_34_30]